MHNMNDFLKNLRHTTDKLTNMNFDQSNPWQSINDMKQMFNNDFWANLGKLVQQPNPDTTTPVSAVMPEERTQIFPSIDVYDTLGKIVVCCELPGLVRNSFKFSITEGNRLSLQGKMKEHHLKEHYVSKERFNGKFNRTIELPSQISPKPIETSYVDGILELVFAKKQGESS